MYIVTILDNQVQGSGAKKICLCLDSRYYLTTDIYICADYLKYFRISTVDIKMETSKNSKYLFSFLCPFKPIVPMFR